MNNSRFEVAAAYLLESKRKEKEISKARNQDQLLELLRAFSSYLHLVENNIGEHVTDQRQSQGLAKCCEMR